MQNKLLMQRNSWKLVSFLFVTECPPCSEACDNFTPLSNYFTKVLRNSFGNKKVKKKKKTKKRSKVSPVLITRKGIFYWFWWIFTWRTFSSRFVSAPVPTGASNYLITQFKVTSSVTRSCPTLKSIKKGFIEATSLSEIFFFSSELDILKIFFLPSFPLNLPRKSS